VKTTSELFEDLTQDAPPSTVDIAGIVGAQRRRRLGMRATGAVAVIAAAVAGAAAIQPGAARPQTPIAGPGSAVPEPPAFALVANDSASAARLRAALDAAVHRQAPDARWFAEGDTLGQKTPEGQPPLIVGDTADRMFTGLGGLATGGLRGTVQLGVIAPDVCDAACRAHQKGSPRGDGLTCPPPSDEHAQCATGTTAGRRWMRISWPRSAKGVLEYDYRAQLADGRVLSLVLDNRAEAADGTWPAAQAATPLTTGQLIAVTDDIAGRIRK
jgi:hypothetical protein